jgi:NADH:ubiquinone reductase (H+-translocating)
MTAQACIGRNGLRRLEVKELAGQVPHVVIIGGGFGGLAAAKALKGAPVRITLIDRSNHHLFQPLLYQVAISYLSPAHIASPIRSILRNQKNVTVEMMEFTGLDKDQRLVHACSPDGSVSTLTYDFLILAPGVRHSYFGHDEFEKFAPGLKSLADAVAIRNKVLGAFELAETEKSPSKHGDLLTFVLVGAGPTGVETAAAIAVLIKMTLQSQFRRISLQRTRIVLIDGGNRVLASFSEHLSQAAQKRLQSLGVEVRLGSVVEQVDQDGVTLSGGERIVSKTVIWAAGVAPSPIAQWLGAPADKIGRVRIEKDLTVPGHPEIFVIGDAASLDRNGLPLPGVAQVAMQQGRYAGRAIRGRLSGKPLVAPFSYFDKGNMAVIGRNFAVLESGKVRMSGMIAWLAWVAVHLQFLGQSSLRLTVFVQWIWSYLTGQGGSYLIVNHHAMVTAPAIATRKEAGSP